MTLGSILTICSILIAMISFAYNSYQRIVLYKFHYGHIFVVVTVLLLISYLLMFDFMVAHGCYIKALYLEGNYMPLPEQWAYIITLIFLGLCVWKFFFSHNIPRCRYKDLICYYEELIEGNTLLLIRYLREYHSKDISKHIDLINKFCEEEENNEELLFKEPNEEQSTKSSPNLPALIFERIIFNPSFVRAGIKHNSIFFLDMVSQFTSDRVNGLKDAVGCYYCTLLQEKNPILCESINHTNNLKFDTQYQHIAYRIDEYKFSELTFGNLDFTCNLEVWKAFGEEGLKDAEMNPFYQRKTNEWTREEYRKMPARLCLSFYDILIRQLVYRGLKENLQSQEFIYPYYIYLICNAAIKSNAEYLDNNIYALELLDDAKWFIYEWIDILVKNGQSRYLGSILDIVNSIICISDISKDLKFDFSKKIIEKCKDYCDSCEENVKPLLEKFLSRIPDINT